MVLNLEPAEVHLIVQALAAQPYRQVAALLPKIIQQAEEQEKAGKALDVKG